MLNVQNFQVLLTVLFSMFCLILRRTQNYLLHDINWLVLKTIISVFTVRCSWIFKYNWGYPWYLKGSTNTTANSSACSSHVRIIQSAFHTHSYYFFTDTIIYIYIYTYIYIYIYICRVSQEECARLWESVPYVKLYRCNPKHLYPKLNGYGDNGHRKVSGVSTYCTPSVTPYSSIAHALQLDTTS